jgi:NDP-sugar pyrophosphorylase family protein
MKTVIMSGCKGTRVSAIMPDIPKPMIPILDKSILEYQINPSPKGYLRNDLCY